MRLHRWVDPCHITGPVISGVPVNLALGVFDGVHRGHQELLRRAVTAARRHPGGISTVLTFDPNPAAVLRPDLFPGNVSTMNQRLAEFRRFEIDETVVIRFSREFSLLPGERFLQNLITAVPALKTVVVGYNFHMGHNRDVGAEKLKDWLSTDGIRVDIVPALKDNDDSISSSRVRRAIATGDLGQVGIMTGRPYTIEVGKSPPKTRQECRQLLPPAGVYVCTFLTGGSSREGMMEISESGDIQWEPRITKNHSVIPRRRVDVSDSTTKE